MPLNNDNAIRCITVDVRPAQDGINDYGISKRALSSGVAV